MALFDKFPYTNFHELNLDWIISKLSDLKTSTETAVESAKNAKLSETNAKLSETNAKKSETNAKLSETNAKLSETNAKLSETNAKKSETNAKLSETNANESAETANLKAEETERNAAQTNNDASQCYILSNQVSADAAKAAASESKASNSAANAKSDADRASAIAGSLASAVYYYSSDELVLSSEDTNSGSVKLTIRNGILHVVYNNSMKYGKTVESTSNTISIGGLLILSTNTVKNWVEGKTGPVKWGELADVSVSVGAGLHGTKFAKDSSVNLLTGTTSLFGRSTKSSDSEYYSITLQHNYYFSGTGTVSNISTQISFDIPLKFSSDE